MSNPVPEHGSSWPAFDTVLSALRRTGRSDIAVALQNAVAGGATGTEILGRIGLILRAHDAARSRLTSAEQRAWDAVMRDVNRAQPPRAFTYWLRRLIRP